jgi:hypothetical protein
MVVARLLARIEAIKIPPLPADLVRTPAMTEAINAAATAQTNALRAVDQRLTAKLATVQRLVAEFRAELAALGVRVTAVEEELAALRARLDNVQIAGDMRFRYEAFPSGSVSGGGTFQAPDVRMRARLTFTGRVAPNVDAVVRLWTANLAGIAEDADERFGGGFFFNSVAFDYLYLDVRGVLGANWRLGRQPYSLAPYGPGGGLLFDPDLSCGFGSGFLYAPFVVGTACTVDGLRADWTLGPVDLQVALFQETTAAPSPGLGGPPDRQYRVVRATTGAILPGWTLGGSWFEQGASPYLPAGAFFGGTGWGVDLSGELIPGLMLYADYASWQFRLVPGSVYTAPAVSAWRVGGNLNLATVAGITTWSPTLDFEYHNYGGPPAGALAWAPPRYSYGTTVFGQLLDWDMRGWLARLNLTFSPRWSAFIMYEGGNQISTGDSYSEWWLRLTHELTTNTAVYFQYTRGTIGGFDTFNFYRAELSTSW